MKNTYELTPRFDARQSFYGKALVEEGKNEKVLYSYLTKVCTIKKNNTIKLNKKVDKDLLFSQTTLRHIKEFIRQETGQELIKKDLVALVG